METRPAQHEVIRAALRALKDAGVKTGSDVVVVEGGPQLLDAVHHQERRPDGGRTMLADHPTLADHPKPADHPGA